jgi:hypothetical protein
MLSHSEGEAVALRHKDYLLSIVVDFAPPFNKQMQVNIYIQQMIRHISGGI